MAPLTLRERIARVADRLGLLEERGELAPLDSLMMVDLVIALEEELGIVLPVQRLRPDAFEDLDALARLLAETFPSV